MGTPDKELLAHYLSGVTTNSENELIESWIAESEENRQFLEQYFLIWQTSKIACVMRSVDTQAALASFNGRVRKKERKKRLTRYVFWIERVAAVIVLPVLLLSGYLYSLKSEEDKQIHYLEVKTNPGVISSVMLPDGTKVWINSGSSLKYPVRFAGKKREVVLDGEGYFEVAKNERLPFSVKTRDNYAVEVLGTEFNVKAYPGEKKIETTLVAGEVNLNIDVSARKQIYHLLKPNQKGVYENGQLSVQWVDPVYEVGWKDGKMYFKNLPMEDVIRRLSRHYNVTFDVKKESVLESSITAKFESEQLLQIMEYIRLASGIKYKVHGANIEGDRLNKMAIELIK